MKESGAAKLQLFEDIRKDAKEGIKPLKKAIIDNQVDEAGKIKVESAWMKRSELYEFVELLEKVKDIETFEQLQTYLKGKEIPLELQFICIRWRRVQEMICTL